MPKPGSISKYKILGFFVFKWGCLRAISAKIEKVASWHGFYWTPGAFSAIVHLREVAYLVERKIFRNFFLKKNIFLKKFHLRLEADLDQKNLTFFFLRFATRKTKFPVGKKLARLTVLLRFSGDQNSYLENPACEWAASPFPAIHYATARRLPAEGDLPTPALLHRSRTSIAH